MLAGRLRSPPGGWNAEERAWARLLFEQRGKKGGGEGGVHLHLDLEAEASAASWVRSHRVGGRGVDCVPSEDVEVSSPGTCDCGLIWK